MCASGCGMVVSVNNSCYDKGDDEAEEEERKG